MLSVARCLCRNVVRRNVIAPLLACLLWLTGEREGQGIESNPQTYFYSGQKVTAMSTVPNQVYLPVKPNNTVSNSPIFIKAQF